MRAGQADEHPDPDLVLVPVLVLVQAVRHRKTAFADAMLREAAERTDP